MSGLQAALVRQFRRPDGALGHVAGWIMSHRGSNVQRSRWSVDLLDLRPDHRVLEIGFGPGLALALAAERAHRGLVAGIDHSEVMWRQAARRNRRAIAAGRVQLHRASVTGLPALGEPFHRIFTVNCLMFWPEPVETLRALQALLRPDGLLAVTHQPRRPGAGEADVDRAAAEIQGQLRAAGLSPCRTEKLPLEPVSAVCVLAQRGDEGGPARG